jgi:hypothetical protein
LEIIHSASLRIIKLMKFKRRILRSIVFGEIRTL